MKVRNLFFGIIYFIFALVLFIAACVLLAFIQEKLFLPEDYIMWIFKYPVSRLIFIFESYIGFVFFKIYGVPAIIDRAKRHKKWTYPIFVFANLLIIYALLFNVSVITQNSIINHSFLSPQGKVYNYSDIISIDTGVYGKKRYLPFTHYSGQFYYLIKLKDGATIDLNGDAGGTQNNRDIYQVFEEIDHTLVNMGINKTSKIETFGYFDKNIDKIYADRIKNVLNNIK